MIPPVNIQVHLNVNSSAFQTIKILLQIVGAFQEPYYSHDTSLISIKDAKPDMFDSGDNVACSFLNLQIMHVLQYSRCLHSIKHLTKPASVCLGMSVLTECGVLNVIRHLVDADYRILRHVCMIQSLAVWGSCNCVLRQGAFQRNPMIWIPRI